LAAAAAQEPGPELVSEPELVPELAPVLAAVAAEAASCS